MIFYVCASIVLAIFAGIYTGSDPVFLSLYSLIGKLFLNALSLVVVPLVAASVITGTARMARDGSFKTLGKRTLCFFLGTTTLAVLTGFLVSIWMQPGLSEIPLASLQPLTPEKSAFDAFSDILLKVVPKNIFAAAAEGQILGVIVFCILFGLSIPASSILLGFWEGTLQVMMRITRFVMNFLPIGVFGLVAKVVAESGPELLQRSGFFMMATLLGLAIYAFLLLPLLLRLFGINPIKHIQAMGPAMLTAFTTSSSAATIPVTLECLEKRAGVSERIASFIVPLGCTLNLSGSALYVMMAVMTVAQSYGVEFTFASSALLIMMTIMMATGMAGIPSACVVTVMLILQTMGLPAEGIGMVLVVDRILDMARTSVTVFGNSCCAALVECGAKEEETVTA